MICSVLLSKLLCLDAISMPANQVSQISIRNVITASGYITKGITEGPGKLLYSETCVDGHL